MGRNALLRVALLTVILACKPAHAGEPRFMPDDLSAEAMGPNVAVVITWRPGTTDSLTFSADSAGVITSSMQVLAPFAATEIDTLVLGARPAPGVSVTWIVLADYWYTDTGMPINGVANLGTASYTEPFPAGVPPSFDPLPPPDTTSGPQVGIVELEVWPDSVNAQPGETIQFCALARLSNAPSTWVALDTDSAGVISPAPGVCLAVAASRNPPSGSVESIG
ncbi:MAG: hypothetical protein GY906_38570 [bacterium]|nr:hypothetical protein [bacterium]